ncbi:hypothetical protein M3592_25870 [Priestia aryabhattai]|uniref:hypothetical protein n=1 Tax=Priestia aryabhattai TaxID=412384 RepID=UPI00203AAB74|nr:hypothetical protein [Priestia aryabhattai]MCM2978872.1 hypothetical protein [Priestia aryabhattai]
MDTKLVPMLHETKVTFNKKAIFKTAQNRQQEFKKKMKFQEIEITNDTIYFKEGFPIILLTITETSLRIVSLFREKENVYKEIRHILETLGFSHEDKITISQFELVYLLNIGSEEELHNFFINSIDNKELGEIIESTMRFKTLKDNKEVMYFFKFNSGEASVANISLESPVETEVNNNLIEAFIEAEKFLFDNMDCFLRTRDVSLVSRG